MLNGTLYVNGHALPAMHAAGNLADYATAYKDAVDNNKALIFTTSNGTTITTSPLSVAFDAPEAA